MAKGKLSTFVIDCRTDDIDAAAAFWSKALGRPLNPPHPGFDRYRDLVSGPSEVLVYIQRVEHDSRVHLDIESDDVEGEVARLTALGAKEIERVRTWVVMEAPTGHRFCVVRVQRGPGNAPAYEGTGVHARLRTLEGDFSGETRTWLDPNGGPPDVSKAQLHVESIFGGRWLRLEHRGKVGDTPHNGEMLLGFHAEAGEVELCWIDSFHTGTSMMLSKGRVRDDGVLDVLGSYSAGGERWGWRTEIAIGETLVVRAFNVAPSGAEERAIETVWTRLSPPGIR